MLIYWMKIWIEYHKVVIVIIIIIIIIMCHHIYHFSVHE